MKVKSLESVDTDLLTKIINEFIKNKHVIDIKYSIGRYSRSTVYSALVIYETDD